MSSAGARTHENETRPEEIYGNQRVGLLSEFSYKYLILMAIKHFQYSENVDIFSMLKNVCTF